MEFTVKLSSAFVTRWNEDTEDWSGDTFIKDGYTLGTVKHNDINTVKAFIREYFDVDDEDFDLDNGALFFSVVENEQARQDEDGHFLVDYHVELEAVQTIEIEEY